MRCIPDVPAGGRNRSKPQDLEGKLQHVDALLSIIRFANALTVLFLEACAFKDPRGMTELCTDP